MSRYLLDTSAIIWYLRGREDARRIISDIKTASVPGCSALSLLEIVVGERKSERQATREFLDALRVVPVHRREATLAGELIKDFQARGFTLDVIDAVIGATCLIHDLVLVTYNPKHFPLSDLKLYPM
jgi:predicted nucleic acid-binding protein